MYIDVHFGSGVAMLSSEVEESKCAEEGRLSINMARTIVGCDIRMSMQFKDFIVIGSPLSLVYKYRRMSGIGSITSNEVEPRLK